MNLQQSLKMAQQKLSDQGFEEAGADAFLLLEEATGIDRTSYLLHQMDEMLPEQEQHFKEMLEQRLTHVPLQHIIGHAPFYGREFLVGEQVLTPRFDTENLIEEALTYLHDGMRVLDVCTGSGCILLTLLAECQGLAGEGLDLSEEALALAERNAQALDIKATFKRSNMFEAAEGKYDMIVSNPPYIPTVDIEDLMEEVKLHEPVMALDGGEDGLDFYRILARESSAYLNDGGYLIMEIGYDQGDAVSNLLADNGFTDIKVIKDLSGLDRVVKGEYHV